MGTQRLQSTVWSPLFNRSEAFPLEHVIASIAQALAGADIVRLYGANLSSGMAGAAVFFGHLHLTSGEDRWASVASSWLTESVATALRYPLRLPFYSGAPGVAWAIEHLAPSVGRHEVDFSDAVERMVFEQLATSNWKATYDLVSGLVGLGLYALERLPHAHGTAILTRVVERLAGLVVSTPYGLTWLTPPELLDKGERQRYPHGYFNLGLAHGVPGVIALLAQASAVEAVADRVRPMLDGSVAWLLAQQNPAGEPARFARVVPAGEIERFDRGSRVAWCYGDLGAAVALKLAAVYAGRQDWADTALDIARDVALRPYDEALDLDACLCHGAAGNGHIFNRFYQATREDVFRDAARRWFQRALSYYRVGRGVGGFAGWWSHSDSERSAWRYVPGIIRGTAGIGLALVSAIGDVEPSWDRLLAVSIPASFKPAGASPADTERSWVAGEAPPESPP